MKPIKYWLILFLASVLFPFLAQAYQEADLDLDYYLYKERKGQQTAMAYVADLNQRIESSHKENKEAFEYLTSLLTNVLTTGGPFGIRSTGPTQEEQTILNVSFQHLARRAVILSNEDGKGKTQTLRTLVNDTDYYNNWNKSLFTKSQADGVYNSAFNFLETVDQKPLDDKNWEDNDWFRFTPDGKVIIRDLITGYEFYLLKTDPDGACWMHAMACSNSPEFTGKGFINKLLSLNDPERKAVCEYQAGFFYRILFLEEEYKTLLKDKPALLQQAGNLASLFQNKTYRNLSPENQSKVVDFISQELVFDVLVTRKGKNNHDTKSLVTSTGENVWNSLQGSSPQWPKIWAFVYKKNIRVLNYSKRDSKWPLAYRNQSMYTSSNPWGFFYQGPKDFHISALWPVDVTPPKGMQFADQSYFNSWHTLKSESLS